MPNADIEALLIPAIASALTVRAVTELPADLAGVVPVVQVVRIGGPDDDNLPAFDLPTVDIDSFDADRGKANELAARVHDWMRTTLPGTVHDLAGGGTAVVTKVQTITGPSWRPYDDTALRRIGATYRLTVRSRP